MRSDTIVALSSGQGRAAIGIIRISGPQVRFVIETFLSASPVPRRATLSLLSDPVTGAVLDRCLVLLFPGPGSVTGEDLLELHVHGSLAVVRGALQLLTQYPSIRLAEPGEFTRRGLENGKLDLLQVEALGDLLCAETVVQLQQAQRQMSGELGRLCSAWRQRLIEIRSRVEAELDFADEGDVQSGQFAIASLEVQSSLRDIKLVLGQADRGRRVRDGASVVIVGAPNAGKSSLINALAARDVAIVSDTAGTTRDAIEAVLDMDGWPVVLVDTAGLRESGDPIEIEGVRRAHARAASADVILSVSAWDTPAVDVAADHGAVLIRVGTKSDLQAMHGVDVSVSAVTGSGIAELCHMIASVLRGGEASEPALIARARQRDVVEAVCTSLESAANAQLGELMAEDLRRASFLLGKLVGETDLDSVLDHLFQGFCIGK